MPFLHQVLTKLIGIAVLNFISCILEVLLCQPFFLFFIFRNIYSLNLKVALAAMAKSCAWLRGRKFVYPDDVADIFYDVAIHRIRLNAKARINHVTAEGLIEQIINETERPTVRRKNV